MRQLKFKSRLFPRKAISYCCYCIRYTTTTKGAETLVELTNPHAMVMMRASLRFSPFFLCISVILINTIYLSHEHAEQSFSSIREVAKHSENFIKIFGEFYDENELLRKNNHITEDHYQKYVNLFNKTYNETDSVRRLSIFKENVKKIIEFKLNYISGISSSISEINYFTDLVS